MINIDTYIIEKFKINKDTKLPSFDYTPIIKKIAKMCQYNFNKVGDEKFINVISNWVCVNDVREIRAICEYDVLINDTKEEIVNLFQDDPKEVRRIVMELAADKDKYLVKLKNLSPSDTEKIYTSEKYFVMHDYWGGQNYDRVFIKEN